MGLDFVEMVMGWEESFGISIPDSEAEMLRTPRQAIDLIAGKLSAQDEASQPCLTLRAFNRVRRSITSGAGISRDRIRPEACFRDLVSRDRRRTRKAVRLACGISSLPGLGWLLPRTTGDLARWAVVHAAKDLKPPGEPWTRSEIRSVVRAVVTDASGVEDFEDDRDFFRDIGLG